MPASSATSSIDAAWNPRREKTRTAASSICCSRTARGNRLNEEATILVTIPTRA
jgi:hypothetical protein